MAGRYCTICTHSKLTEIDAALLGGGSSLEVARTFGLKAAAIRRHRERHLAPRIEAAARTVAPHRTPEGRQLQAARNVLAGNAPDPATLLDMRGLLERVARSLDRLEGAADTTAQEGAYAALAAVSAQLHRGVEAAAKLQGLGAAKDRPKEPAPGIIIQLPPGFGGPVVLGGKSKEPEACEGVRVFDLDIPVPEVLPPLRVPPDDEPTPEPDPKEGPFTVPGFEGSVIASRS